MKNKFVAYCEFNIANTFYKYDNGTLIIYKLHTQLSTTNLLIIIKIIFNKINQFKNNY